MQRLKSHNSNNAIKYLISVLVSFSLFLFSNDQSSYFWLIFALILCVFLILKPYFLIISLAIFFISKIIQISIQPTINELALDNSYRVIDLNTFGIVIKHENSRVLVLTREALKINDIVSINGQIEIPKNTGNFDFVRYLKTEKVFYISKSATVNLLEHTTTPLSYVEDHFTSGEENYHKYLSLLFLGKRTKLNSDIYTTALELNVLHLFVISGFHMGIYYKILALFFKLIKVPTNYSVWIIMLILSIYLTLLNFPLSASRAVLYLVLAAVNKHFLKNYFSKVTLIVTVMIFFFLLNPYSIYSLSFIFSFLATLTIFFVLSFNIKTRWRLLIAIYISVYLITIPVSIFINQWFTVFGFLFNIVFTPIFSFFYTLCIIFVPFKEVLNNVLILFESILFGIAKINILLEVNASLMVIHFAYFTVLPVSFGLRIYWNSMKNKLYNL